MLTQADKKEGRVLEQDYALSSNDSMIKTRQNINKEKGI